MFPKRQIQLGGPALATLLLPRKAACGQEAIMARAWCSGLRGTMLKGLMSGQCAEGRILYPGRTVRASVRGLEACQAWHAVNRSFESGKGR